MFMVIFKTLMEQIPGWLLYWYFQEKRKNPCYRNIPSNIGIYRDVNFPPLLSLTHIQKPILTSSTLFFRTLNSSVSHTSARVTIVAFVENGTLYKKFIFVTTIWNLERGKWTRMFLSLHTCLVVTVIYIVHASLYSSIMYLTWETGCVCAREGSVVQTRARVTTVPLSKCLSCRVMFSFMLTIWKKIKNRIACPENNGAVIGISTRVPEQFRSTVTNTLLLLICFVIVKQETQGSQCSPVHIFFLSCANPCRCTITYVAVLSYLRTNLTNYNRPT